MRTRKNLTPKIFRFTPYPRFSPVNANCEENHAERVLREKNTLTVYCGLPTYQGCVLRIAYLQGNRLGTGISCTSDYSVSYFQDIQNTSNPVWLPIENVTHESEGWYTCVAMNTLGTTCASAYLKVVDSE